ncbi:MAG: histidine phosphatase family protein, partial [Acidimicrobiia bacterium]
GEWTGLLPGEIAARWPELWGRYVAGEDVPRPGGERWAEVRERAVEAVLDHARKSSAGDLLVVSTHGGPGLHLVAWAAGIEQPGNVFRGAMGPLANASVSTLRLPGPTLLAYNDTGHLDGVVLHRVPAPYLPAEEE